MSKTCGKCAKTVYPTEELKCLDKVWHKACFKCSECNMTLNMKNYKGYNKMPYCNAHYPKSSHTSVADTPEMLRLAENTKVQSNVTYHKQYEGMKGQKLTVIDDPETLRHKFNTTNISEISYRGIKQSHADMEAKRSQLGPGQVLEHTSVSNDGTNKSQHKSAGHHIYDSTTVGRENEAPMLPGVGSIADYDPVNSQFGSAVGVGSQRQEWQESVPLPRTDEPFASIPMGQPLMVQYEPTDPTHYYPQAHQAHRQPAPPPTTIKGDVYIAMYDYTAGDVDEVSFKDGDEIIKPELIDDGWMIGTVKKTGARGMLPANYVKKM